MTQALQAKPFKKKDGQNYKVIQITDFSFHSSNYRPTSIVKALEKSENGEPGRIYSPLEKIVGSQNNLVVRLLNLDPEFVKYAQEQEALGFKIVISIPKKGIPMLVGKDAEEFINSIKGQRVLRWIDKKNH